MDFPHKLFLKKRLVINICKVFAKQSTADIKFSTSQSERFLGALLGKLTGVINEIYIHSCKKMYFYHQD